MPKYNPSAYTAAYRAGMTNTNPKGTISTKKQMERRAKNRKGMVEFKRKVKKTKSSLAASYNKIGSNLPKREIDHYMELQDKMAKKRANRPGPGSPEPLVRAVPGTSRKPSPNVPNPRVAPLGRKVGFDKGHDHSGTKDQKKKKKK